MDKSTIQILQKHLNAIIRLAPFLASSAGFLMRNTLRQARSLQYGHRLYASMK